MKLPDKKTSKEPATASANWVDRSNENSQNANRYASSTEDEQASQNNVAYLATIEEVSDEHSDEVATASDDECLDRRGRRSRRGSRHHRARALISQTVADSSHGAASYMDRDEHYERDVETESTADTVDLGPIASPAAPAAPAPPISSSLSSTLITNPMAEGHRCCDKQTQTDSGWHHTGEDEKSEGFTGVTGDPSYSSTKSSSKRSSSMTRTSPSLSRQSSADSDRSTEGIVSPRRFPPMPLARIVNGSSMGRSLSDSTGYSHGSSDVRSSSKITRRKHSGPIKNGNGGSSSSSSPTTKTVKWRAKQPAPAPERPRLRRPPVVERADIVAPIVSDVASAPAKSAPQRRRPPIHCAPQQPSLAVPESPSASSVSSEQSLIVSESIRFSGPLSASASASSSSSSSTHRRKPPLKLVHPVTDYYTRLAERDNESRNRHIARHRRHRPHSHYRQLDRESLRSMWSDDSSSDEADYNDLFRERVPSYRRCLMNDSLERPFSSHQTEMLSDSQLVDSLDDSFSFDAVHEEPPVLHFFSGARRSRDSSTSSLPGTPKSGSEMTTAMYDETFHQLEMEIMTMASTVIFYPASKQRNNHPPLPRCMNNDEVESNLLMKDIKTDDDCESVEDSSGDDWSDSDECDEDAVTADGLGELVTFGGGTYNPSGELDPRVPAYVPSSESMWRRRSDCRMPNAVVIDADDIEHRSTVILALDSIKEDAELS